MPADGPFCFEPYRLEVRNARLWRGSQELHLTAKAFAVLCHLVQHAGQLVTKDDLFAAVWPETLVSERALARLLPMARGATELPVLFTQCKGHQQDALCCGIMLVVGRCRGHGLSPPW